LKKKKKHEPQMTWPWGRLVMAGDFGGTNTSWIAGNYIRPFWENGMMQKKKTFSGLKLK